MNAILSLTVELKLPSQLSEKVPHYPLEFQTMCSNWQLSRFAHSNFLLLQNFVYRFLLDKDVLWKQALTKAQNLVQNFPICASTTWLMSRFLYIETVHLPLLTSSLKPFLFWTNYFWCCLILQEDASTSLMPNWKRSRSPDPCAVPEWINSELGKST